MLAEVAGARIDTVFRVLPLPWRTQVWRSCEYLPLRACCPCHGGQTQLWSTHAHLRGPAPETRNCPFSVLGF